MSLLQGSFTKETYNFIDPTNQSHPIVENNGGGTSFVQTTWDKEQWNMGGGLRMRDNACQRENDAGMIVNVYTHSTALSTALKSTHISATSTNAFKDWN